jgi:hypothetical protein
MRDRFCFHAFKPRARRAAVACGSLGATLLFAGAAFADPSALPPEIGYNYGLTETPRTAAMGGAQRAMSNSTDALYINPANMATTRVYHVGALAQIWPEANRQSYGLSIVDSIVSASRLAGGLGASWNRQDPDGVDRTAWDLRFALAYPLSDNFYLGAAAHYLSLRQSGFPRGQFDLRPSQASAGLSDDPIVKNITFDAGVTLKPVPELAISLVGANLTDPGYSFLPLTFGGGVGYGNTDFTLEADILGDFSTYSETKVRAMAGGEYLAGNHVPLRLGYRYDQGPGSHTLTGGIGYIDSSYAVELALQRSVSGPESTAVIIGFRYHVESGGGIAPGSGYDE